MTSEEDGGRRILKVTLILIVTLVVNLYRAVCYVLSTVLRT